MSTTALVTDFPRPEPSAPRPYHFPRFARTALDNGLGVVVAPARKLPVVTLLLVSEAGAVRDPVGKEGVAQLAASLRGDRHVVRRVGRLGRRRRAPHRHDVAPRGGRAPGSSGA